MTAIMLPRSEIWRFPGPDSSDGGDEVDSMYYTSGMNASDYSERLKTTGRNDSCPCGSGKKYKKCHLAEDEAAKHQELGKAAEDREAASAAAEENPEEESDESATKKKKQKQNGRQHIGKARNGQDSNSNIPRRGAV